MGTVVFLAREDQQTRERRGYAAAFRRAGWTVLWWPRGGDDTFLDLLSHVDQPALVVRPDVSTEIPVAITAAPCPTVSFEIDTFTFPRTRLARSALFDYVACFHHGWDSRFGDGGHSGAFLLPHAFDPTGSVGTVRRIWDVGWVGRLDGPLYGTRRIVLPEMRKQFTMNPWWERRYREDQVVSVYSRALCVLNIGRDDYPQDANLRVFEAMGAGALLVARLPSELSEYGFRIGEHFVGYRTESEIIPLIRSFLDQPSRLTRIARAGQTLVHTWHTYDARLRSLLDHALSGDRRAPGRSWPPSRVAALILEQAIRERAWHQLRSRGGQLAGTSRWSALRVPARIVRDRVRRDPLVVQQPR